MSIQYRGKKVDRPSGGKEFLQEVVGIVYRNTIPFDKIEQMSITGDDSLCLGGTGGLKDSVVSRAVNTVNL
ncbi:MAG: hypothetical protein HGB36_13915 [Chlorobiaceae bacterium]|nr:hypothetical protein [Chlorobiaceae bacterium]